MKVSFTIFLSGVVSAILLIQSSAMEIGEIPKANVVKEADIIVDIPSFSPPLLPDPSLSTILSKKATSQEIENINIDEDIPGCVDNYLRCTRDLYRISLGWIGLGALATTCVGVTLQTLSNYGALPATQQAEIGLAAIIITGVSGGLQALGIHAKQAIQDKNTTLREVIAEYNTIKTQLAKFQMEIGEIPKANVVKEADIIVDIPSFSPPLLPDPSLSTILSKKATSQEIENINIDEDIPGCVDNYLRCTRDLYRISLGWIGLGALATTCVGVTLQTLSNYGALPATQQAEIGLAAIMITGVSGGLQALGIHAKQAIQDKNTALREVIAEYNTIKAQLVKFQMEDKQR